MNGQFLAADWFVLIAYFAGTMGIGFYNYRRTRSADGYTAGNRALPGWVCGLSIFATFLSSISYLALPGKSFAANWNPFVFSLSLPFVVWIAARYFLPYYRRSGEVSAYALLEKRFGVWARVYASIFYLLTQIARIGIVLYLMALPMQVIFGWNIYTILIITGFCVTLYSFAGGIIAVIWTDAIQALVLMAGALICLAAMLAGIPGGASQVIEVASQFDKFSLGDFGLTLAEPTFWVVLIYGIVINLQNFGIDQSYVQRYISSKSSRAARRGLWLGGLLYVPVSALFFFIGSALFVYYGADDGGEITDDRASSLTVIQAPGSLREVKDVVASQRLLQEGIHANDPGFNRLKQERAAHLRLSEIGDRVFPHFIATRLPAGLTGLLIAAVFAAAMSTVSTSMNSSATLIMSDYYKRFIRPDAAEKETMTILYAGTVLWGMLGTGLALLLVKLTESALDMWWTLAGIFGGGMTGLFLLGMISQKAKNPAAISGVIVGVLVILWLSLPQAISGWQELVHAYMVPVFGTLSILLVGIGITVLRRKTKAL